MSDRSFGHNKIDFVFICLSWLINGNRQVPVGFSRQGEIERLVQAIQRVLERKGSILMPTFALGRTQEILALLALRMREGKLKPQPIYIQYQ